jgi:eukaryotic-like serine/threonine-protein kinase
MTYCHECGSEVAELDIFCPYCGISLTPVAIAGNPADDEMASTVIMPLPAKLTEQSPNPQPTENAQVSTVQVGVEAGGSNAAPPDREPDALAVEEIEQSAPAPSVPRSDSSGTGASDNTQENLVAGDIMVGSDTLPEKFPGIGSPMDYSGPARSESPEEELQPAIDSEAGLSSAFAESNDPERESADAGDKEILAGVATSESVPDEPIAEHDPVVVSDPPIANRAQAPSQDADRATTDGQAKSSEMPPDVDPAPPGGTTPNIGTATTDGRKGGLKPLSEGTILSGRYRIAKKIGGGGMGAVYLAFDQNLGGTQRAVKEMVQSHIEEEQQAKAVEDFKRESTILSTLDHPAIPTIYDYFYDDAESRFYLVMKYISGGDLASRLRASPEGRIDERTVTEWAIQIIDVLDYLHSLPTTIVYRDLKPSNVMIDGNTGRIMLIDFGIARSINQNQEKGVTAVGTMGYAPPELFSGQVEPRSDIYSLGSTMFHLLTGADPQNNPLLIFDFQKNPRPRQINPRLSDQMERILMRAVEYNADSRFASAADMRRSLQDHLQNLLSGNVTYGITESPAAVSLAYQTVFCGFCGQRIVATDLFCAFCGSKQPIAQQGVHSEIYSRGNVTARLVIEGTGDLSAPAYSLEKKENLVGRRDPMSNIFPEVDLSKYDPQTKISRRHARIWRDGGEFLVEDLGSSNGTLLLSRVSDTLRLSPHKPHPLASGDRLRIGDTTLQFIVG